MLGHRCRSPFIVLIAVLLLMVTLGCSCGQMLQEWLTQLVQDLTRAVELWIREQIAQFIAHLQQQIVDWWNGLVRDIQQGVEDVWREIRQGVTDLWSSLFPPAPVIVEPNDGFMASGMRLKIQGTALRNGTVTLFRNGVSHRTVKADASGEWAIGDVELNAGDNTFTATVRDKLLASQPSNSVKVTWVGEELGAVPAMTPAIDASLDPAAWMVELALELLAADGNAFYEDQRMMYTAALRMGLEASRQDAETHRFINVEGPLTFDKHVLALAVPIDATRDAILESLAKAIESAVLDTAVRKTLMDEITASLELLDLTWTVDAGARSFSFRYVSVEFSRTTIYHFDPGAFAKFRARLGTELITGLAVGVPTAILAQAIEMGFGFWGRADADSQVQHYYDLAIRAWNHRDLTGAPLRWGDPANNAFDGDMGYRFGSNQEWAMFYLGRAIFYLQGVADPYYTIPDYLPEAKLYALLVRKGVAGLASKLIEKKMPAVLGKVVGGAQPITALFKAKEIMEWIAGFAEAIDAYEINTIHRPYFDNFIAGHRFDYPMPEDRRSLGATNVRAGYPFRVPADFLLHDSLTVWPMYPQERGQISSPTFSAESLLEARAQEFVLGRWTYRNWREITRDVAQRATSYVHPGTFGQSDKRVPEGAMIANNPYVIREVYSYEITDGAPGAWWNADEGMRFRLVLLDGSVVLGTVGGRPSVQPVDYRYSNTQVLIEDIVWVYVITLDDLTQVAGSDNLSGYHYLDLIAVQGDEKHLYAVFDQHGGSPREVAPGRWTDLPMYLVGIAGNASIRRDTPERDGAARIAADSLEVGAMATRYLLGTFSAEAPAYRPPEPMVCPLNAVCAALGSPATLHIEDRRGRHVGPNAAGGVDLEITGSRYFTSTMSGQQFIVIPNASLRDGYIVRVEGAGSGKFDLDVFYSDGRRDRAYRQAYTDVPIVPGSLAEVAVQVAESLPLRLDETGDGVFDRDVTPARTFEVVVFEPGRRETLWLILIGGVGLIILGSLLLVFAIRRWRRRRGTPAPPAPPGQPQGPVGGAPQTCARCGQVVRPGARFCLHCGAPLAAAPPPGPAVCPRCGTAAQRPGARFCRKCGGPL